MHTPLLTGDATARHLLHGSGAGWRGHISKSLPRIQSA